MVKQFSVETPGLGLHDITAHVASVVRAAGVAEGLCTYERELVPGQWQGIHVGA